MDFQRYIDFRSNMEESKIKRPGIRYPVTEIVEKEGKGGNPPVIIQKGAASLENEKERKFGEYAIVTRKRVNAEGEDESTEVEIQSEAMQKALHDIIGKRSQVGICADPIIFRKPYYSLFHCRHKIKDLAARESNTLDQKQHLEWLSGFISDRLKNLEIIQESQVDKGLIEFKHLPIIFEAGGIVIGQVNKSTDRVDKTEKLERTKNPECFMFHEVSEEQEDPSLGGKFVNIEVFRWGYNGSKFGLVAETLRIAEFPGIRKITELECFPWAYMKDEEKNDLYPKLVARGEKWCDYLKAKSFCYDGIAQVPKRATWTWHVKVVTKRMPGRVILDYQSFMEAFPELNNPLCNTFGDVGEDDLRADQESIHSTDAWEISSQVTLPKGDLWGHSEMDGSFCPSPAQALLCPATSLGYNLEQKDWGYFDIDRLTEVNWVLNPIKELQIDTTQKETLRDLVIDHHSKTWAKSIVPGKGEGLIFLLHGPPGCGKTLTAELLAEEEKCPLLRISCGDLGEFPYEVDRNLQALLNLASRCSAIVLIDEADAFLAKRVIGSRRDYLQNAMVSIFLKHLEYFSGVIFLTTNQQTEFDEAVSSRVVRLHYSALDSKSRARIWNSHLSKGANGAEKDEIKLMCEQLGAEYKLDGREIKTLAQISLALCRTRKQRISKGLIQKMYEMTHDEIST